MFKNVASQKIALFAFDTTSGAAKTGDSANITAYVSKDYGAVAALGDTSATELDSTNAKGWYWWDVTQTESNADTLLFTGKSSTANISIVGQLIFTRPPNHSSLSIDSNGRVDVIKVAGTTQTARDLGASVLLSAGSGTGQLDFTSGVVKANVTQYNGTNATSAAGRPEVNTSHIAGSAVSTSSAQIGVNVIQAAGTAWGSGAITAASIAADAITAAKIADNAIDRATFAADTGMQTARSNTAQAGSNSTITLDASASAADEYYLGMHIFLTGGTGVGQCRLITDYLGATKVATVAPNWVTNPDNTTTFAVCRFAEIPGVRGNVTGSVGTVTGNVGGIGAAGIISSSFSPGAIDAAAIATDAIGSAELAASAVTEIQSGLSTLDAAAVRAAVGLASANLDTQLTAIDDYVDTEVAAIKAKTDQLTFTVANKVDANALALNGDATSAANIAKTTRAIARGTVAAAATTTSVTTSAFSPAGAVADQFKGRIVTFDADTTTTALRGQATDITASTSAATPTLTVTALTTAPASGDTFSVT